MFFEHYLVFIVISCHRSPLSYDNYYATVHVKFIFLIFFHNKKQILFTSS